MFVAVSHTVPNPPPPVQLPLARHCTQRIVEVLQYGKFPPH